MANEKEKKRAGKGKMAKKPGKCDKKVVKPKQKDRAKSAGTAGQASQSDDKESERGRDFNFAVVELDMLVKMCKVKINLLEGNLSLSKGQEITKEMKNAAWNVIAKAVNG